MSKKNTTLTRIIAKTVEWNNHIFLVVEEGEIQGEYCDIGWYFWDEIGMLGGGPYKTRYICEEKLHEYCQSLG